MSLQTDRPGPNSYCPTDTHDGGSVPTFIGIAYMITVQWEAVTCIYCQRLLRWATDEESALNAALRADDQTPPDIGDGLFP